MTTSTMIDRVVCQRNSALVVPINQCSAMLSVAHFEEEVAQPDGFFCGVALPNILRLAGRRSDSALSLRRPRDRATGELVDVPRRRALVEKVVVAPASVGIAPESSSTSIVRNTLTRRAINISEDAVDAALVLRT